jgi:hypothetical protein
VTLIPEASMRVRYGGLYVQGIGRARDGISYNNTNFYNSFSRFDIAADYDGNVSNMYNIYSGTPTTPNGSINKAYAFYGETMKTSRVNTAYGLYAKDNSGFGKQNNPDATVSIWANAATDVVLKIRGTVSHTANLFQWGNNAGAIWGNISSTGSLSLTPTAVATEPLNIYAPASATANRTQWFNSAGAVMAYVNATGTIFEASGQVCTAANGLCNYTDFDNTSNQAGWMNTSTTTTTNLNVTINGNLTTNGDSTTLGNTTTTYLFVDKIWHAYGGFQNKPTVIDCTGASVWANITNSTHDLWTALEYDGVSMTDDTMVFANTGDYVGSVTVSISGANGDDFFIRIYDLTASEQMGYIIGGTTTGASNYLPINLPVYIEATAGNQYALQIMNLGSAGDATARSSVFEVHYLHS